MNDYSWDKIMAHPSLLRTRLRSAGAEKSIIRKREAGRLL